MRTRARAQVLGAVVLGAAMLAGSPGVTYAQPVRAVGAQFVDAEGAPFRFVGANLGVMHGGTQREALGSAMDAVVAFGGRVVRVWALGDAPDDGQAWRRDFAFRVGPEQPVEESFVHLDHVLAEARARDLRVIVVLANRWHDYGGLPQIARWAGQAPAGDELRPAELDRFWDCAPCAALVDAHVARVVGRVSTLTGERYAEDPTIFAWEIVNESHAHSHAGAEALLRWTAARAAFVRSLDPDHMISAGHIGYHTARGREVWRAACALDAIAYCDAHLYPLHDPRVDSPRALRDYVDDRLRVARALGKPLVFGEVGVTQLERPRGRSAASWLGTLLGRAERGGAAGVLWWIVKPARENRADPFAIHPEDADQALGVRRALRRGARWFERAPRTDRPLGRFDRTQSMFQWGPPLAGWRADEEGGSTIALPVDRFRRARFERTGFHREAPLHLHGSGPGEVTWRLRSPARRAARLVLRARLSSELPGLGGGGPGDGSRVVFELDGVALGSADAVPDDGAGAFVEVATRDPAVLARLARRGVLTLRLRTDSAMGLSVYASDAITLRLER